MNKPAENWETELQLHLSESKDALTHAEKGRTEDILRWCHNYILKQKDSEEKTALLKQLKEHGLV